MRLRTYAVYSLLAAILAVVTACGSGSSSTPSTTVTGSLFAGPVDGSAVVAKDATGAVLTGSVMSSAEGSFSIDIPTAALSADFSIEASGGTFADEATGATTTAGTLSAYVTGGTLTAGSSVNLTPSSTIVHDLVAVQGMSFTDAMAAHETAFGYQPDTSVVPKNAPTDGTDTKECLAGFHAGVFSRLTADLGLAPAGQFDLIAALTQDLADGTLDAKNGSTDVTLDGAALPEDIQNRFERALVSFLSDTTKNLTGLTPDQIGTLPFSKVALTATYRIEYVPGMMAASQGKTSFKLKITKRSDGSAATGLTLSLMPMMHMSDRSHATPVDPTITDNNDGTYSCNLYYLMSSMMGGMSAGYWELKISTGGMNGESVTFYPNVGMAMGDTALAKLKGQADLISSSTGTSNRTYYLFKDSLVSGTTSPFNIFLAAMENMMSFPAISTLVTTTLHDENDAAWAVTSVELSASTDGTNWTPAASETAQGHWSIGSISGLSSGVTSTIYVKLTVNGEVKTLDGAAPSATNSSASFSVTPK